MKLDKSKQIEISEEDILALGQTKCFDLNTMKIVNYDNSNDLKIKKLDELRMQRESECFSIINRGKLWYDKLSDSQIEELNIWYNKWLDVTETLDKPLKPEWLK